ncbi:dihydrofolate reductase [bacterium]|nr:dihydrofolate reductase [bacterium]
MTAIRVYLAMSLDGRIATADGGVAWLDPFGENVDYGYDDFMHGIDVVILGRTTYDQVLTFGEWPYAGKQTFVLTTRPFNPGRDDVFAWTDGAATLAAHARAIAKKGVYHCGGGKSIAAFMEIGEIDTFDIQLMPVVLGAGPMLFPDGCAPASLALADTTPFENGVVRLVYEVVKGGQGNRG